METPRTVWASKRLPPVDEAVILWDSFSTEALHPGSISLPRFIEDHAEVVRDRLLAFLCNARSIEHKGVSLEAALQTTEGLSTWWLTFPALKQWGERQTIPVACRFIALEMIVGSSDLQNLKLESDGRALWQVWNRVINHSYPIRYRLASSFHRRAVHLSRAIGSALRYWFHSRALQSDLQATKPSKSGAIAVFDYLNSDKFAGSKDPYASPYWGAFSDFTPQKSWFHIFPTNIDSTLVRETQVLIQELDRKNENEHQLFLGRIRLIDLLQLAQVVARQMRVHREFVKVQRHFRSTQSSLELWAVFEDEWDDSVLGSTAVRHLILLKTTDRLVKSMPQFEKIYYLMENQPWEIALTHSVRRHRKGELIGVAHSTIRFWDLRYFSDIRENPLLMNDVNKRGPHRLLVNGEIGRDLLVGNHFPGELIDVVEALRYAYLEDLKPLSLLSNKYVVLLGDFLEHANASLIGIFKDAYGQLEAPPRLLIRSHPICPLTEDQLGPLAENLTQQPLPELLQRASMVITTAASSSAAEAAALGIPTVVVLDGRSLNYSPFRSTRGVHTVESASQLANLLLSTNSAQHEEVGSIFCLDSMYPRWRAEIARAGNPR